MSHVRRPTLAHVAKAANVSITTASASLRGTGRVNDETRRHVEEIARRLGYRTNRAASVLREGSGHLVGLVLESAAFDADPLNPKLFWPRFLNGFARHLNAAGVGVVLVSRENLEPLAKAPVDAVVVLADLVGELGSLLPFGMPIIAGSDFDADVVATASHDYVAAAEQCVSHLAAEGARKVALLEPQSPIPTINVVLTLIRQQLEILGIATMTIPGTPDAARVALSSGADALVTVGENLAGLINAAHAAGRSIPKDVLLLSVSESDFTAVTDPAITTLSFLGDQSGRVVAEVARRGVIDDEFESTTLPFELIKRASTARVL